MKNYKVYYIRPDVKTIEVRAKNAVEATEMATFEAVKSGLYKDGWKYLRTEKVEGTG